MPGKISPKGEGIYLQRTFKSKNYNQSKFEDKPTDC